MLFMLLLCLAIVLYVIIAWASLAASFYSRECKLTWTFITGFLILLGLPGIGDFHNMLNEELVNYTTNEVVNIAILMLIIIAIFGLIVFFVVAFWMDMVHGVDMLERIEKKKEPDCEELGHDYQYKFHPTNPTNTCKRCCKS